MNPPSRHLERVTSVVELLPSAAATSSRTSSHAASDPGVVTNVGAGSEEAFFSARSPGRSSGSNCSQASVVSAATRPATGTARRERGSSARPRRRAGPSLQFGRITPNSAPTRSMPTPRPEPGRRRSAPRLAHRATCARTRGVRRRCARQVSRRRFAAAAPANAAASAAVRGSCRIVHHDRQTHGNDDQRHRRCHDHHHPGKRLAPITSVVRHGSTSSGTGPVRRVDGEVVRGGGLSPTIRCRRRRWRCRPPPRPRPRHHPRR